MTYAELSSYLTSFSNRSDLTGLLPDFIAMAEGEMKTLRVRQMVKRADISLTGEYVALPPDFLAERTLMIADHEVLFRTLEAIDAMQCAGSGRPNFYTIVDGDLRLFPAPDQPYAAEITYYADIPPLTADQSNWIIEGFPNAYRFGVMWGVGLKTRDNEAIAIWKAQFDKALADITARFKDKIGRPLRADPAFLQHSRSYGIDR